LAGIAFTSPSSKEEGDPGGKNVLAVVFKYCAETISRPPQSRETIPYLHTVFFKENKFKTHNLGEVATRTQQTLTFYELDLGLNHVVRYHLISCNQCCGAGAARSRIILV
jgi:hypothetical protein